MVCGDDAMILVEVRTSTWCQINFDNILNEEGLDNSAELIEEIKRMAHVRECAAKQRMTMRFNTRVHLRSFQDGNLVLNKVINTKKKGKFSPNKEGPYRIQ